MNKSRLLKRTALVALIVSAAFVLFVPLISRAFLTQYAQHYAEQLLASRVQLGSAELQLLTASVVLHDLKVFYPKQPDKVYMTAGTITMQLKYPPLISGDKGSMAITIDKPTMIFKTDRRGNWELKRHIPLFRRGWEEMRLPLNIEEINVTNGKIDFIDRKVTRKGMKIELSKMDLSATRVRLPTKKDPLPTKFNMSFRINRKARLKMSGRASFLTPKISFDSNIKLSRLALPPFAPYYQTKSLPVIIKEGTMAMTSRAVCKNDWLRAPASVSISGLKVKPKRKLLRGLPAQAVVDSLKSRNGNLHLDMMITGNIRNPRFFLTTNLTRAFVNSISVGLARDVGSNIKESIKGAGQGVGRGVKKGTRKLKGLFR